MLAFAYINEPIIRAIWLCVNAIKAYKNKTLMLRQIASLLKMDQLNTHQLNQKQLS